MDEFVTALLSPISTFGDKKILKKKIRIKEDQEKIHINVNSPDYNGIAYHWVPNLFERINKGKTKEIRYAFIGDNLKTSIEKDEYVATLKMHIPNVDKDAMAWLMRNKPWRSLNDPIYGHAYFQVALPQVTHFQMGEDILEITYKYFSSIPLYGKYMFTTKLQAHNYEKQDPDDFYKKGGIFEIPVYLERPTIEYEAYPIIPPAYEIPSYAIQTKILKDPTRIQELDDPFFFSCPNCGTKLPRSPNLKVCLECWQDVKLPLNL